MKKYLFLILVMAVSLVLASCGVPREESSDDQPLPADSITVTDSLMENVTLQPEPITEAPTEAVLVDPTEPLILCQNDRYTVIVVDGETYVNFVEGNDPTYDAVGGAPILGYTFRDLAEGLYYQTLTEDQIARLKCLQPRKELGLWVPDSVLLLWPDQEAVAGQLSAYTGQMRLTYPSDVSDGGQYTDPSTQFTVELSGGIINFGHMTKSVDETAYETLYSRDFKDYKSRNMTITREESGTYLGYPCEIAEYHGETESYRDIYLTLEEEDREINIEISYCLADTANTGLRPVSDTAPWRVLIFGTENEQNFYAYLYHFSEAPSLTWLFTFGYAWVSDSSVAS